MSLDKKVIESHAASSLAARSCNRKHSICRTEWKDERMNLPVRVLIADDQPRARRSLEALLTAMRWSDSSRNERLIEPVGEAGDGQQAIDQVQALHPDVVVMELHPPTLDGLAAIRTIKGRWPAVRIVVLTMYATDRAAALAAGADAYLLKGCPTRELLAAVIPGRAG
jgi:DNA-binding NarL/FixJ family response regulator